MTGRVLVAVVGVRRVRGGPGLDSMDGVRMALGSRGVTVEAARRCAKNGREW